MAAGYTMPSASSWSEADVLSCHERYSEMFYGGGRIKRTVGPLSMNLSLRYIPWKKYQDTGTLRVVCVCHYLYTKMFACRLHFSLTLTLNRCLHIEKLGLSDKADFVTIPRPHEISPTCLVGTPIVAYWSDESDWYHGLVTLVHPTRKTFDVEWPESFSMTPDANLLAKHPRLQWALSRNEFNNILDKSVRESIERRGGRRRNHDVAATPARQPITRLASQSSNVRLPSYT